MEKLRKGSEPRGIELLLKGKWEIFGPTWSEVAIGPRIESRAFAHLGEPLGKAEPIGHSGEIFLAWGESKKKWIFLQKVD